MIGQLLEGVIIGMTAAVKITWWVLPAAEIFERLKTVIGDLLSGENIKNTDEESI